MVLQQSHRACSSHLVVLQQQRPSPASCKVQAA